MRDPHASFDWARYVEHFLPQAAVAQADRRHQSYEEWACDYIDTFLGDSVEAMSREEHLDIRTGMVGAMYRAALGSRYRSYQVPDPRDLEELLSNWQAPREQARATASDTSKPEPNADRGALRVHRGAVLMLEASGLVLLTLGAAFALIGLAGRGEQTSPAGQPTAPAVRVAAPTDPTLSTAASVEIPERRADQAQDHLENARDYQRAGQVGLAITEMWQALTLQSDDASARQLYAELRLAHQAATLGPSESSVETAEQSFVTEEDDPPMLDLASDPTPPTGTIFTPGFPGVNLRETPSRAAPIIRLVPVGNTVEVLDGTAGADGVAWQQIRTTNSEVGWVTAGTVR